MSARRVVPSPVGKSPTELRWLASPLIWPPAMAPGPKPPGVAAATPVSRMRRARAEASSSAVSPTRRCCAFHIASPALTAWVSPTTKKPSTTTTTSISNSVNPHSLPGARWLGMTGLAACACGSKTQRPQQHLALVAARPPRDRDLDIEQDRCLGGDPVRRRALPLHHRLDVQLPTVAAAIVAAGLSLDQG